MKKVLGAAAAAVLLTAPAMQAKATDIDTRGEIENLRNRLARLEAKAAEEDHLSIFSLTKNITFHGAIEAELSYLSPENEADESDIVLATARFGFQADVADNVHGHLVFLYEEDETPFGVDEGFVTVDLGGAASGAKIAAGQFYLPFGNFDSGMVSDPVTLELGETDRTAVMLQYSAGPAEISVAGFNGDYDPTGKNNIIDGAVAAITVSPVEALSLGASYISDMAETDAELLPSAYTYSSSVDGFSAFATIGMGPVTLAGEYLAALQSFTSAEVAAAATGGSDLTDEKPKAFFVELRGEAGEIAYAVRYENCDDFKDDLKRYGATASWSFADNTALSLEYLYSDTATNPDTDTSHAVTAQLAVEF